ncbi:chitin synthase-domain-containing protein, partial [Dimargaris cristalligena]
AYLGYLLYLAISGTNDVGYVSLILLAAVYGLQALIFLIKRQWQHIGWMIIYILAIPLFSFFLPVYSFWHFDDFSWGNTRVVVGDNKKAIVITDEGKFDPKDIPLKKWAQFEQEMWEVQSNGSQDSRPASRAHTHQSNRPMSTMSHALPQMPMPGPFNTGGRPGSRAGDMMSHFYMGTGAPGSFEHLPSDDEVLQEIRNILATANLMTITKKQVRERLNDYFRCDLTPKKDFINSSIELILQGKL